MAAKTREAGNANSPAGQLAGWARQGIESFMAAQKILLELTAQQNALVIGMMRERLSEPLIPTDAIAELADKGVQNLTAAGKIMVDLAAGESELVVDGVKGVMPLPAVAGTVANLIRHRLVTFADLQKRLLAVAAEQVHEASESYREGKGLMAAGASVAKLARRGLESFVETEKKFLDLAVHEVSAETKAEGKEHKTVRERYKALTQLAREGGEKYIDAQKKLLDLAVEQMESAGKAGGRPEPLRGARGSWGELTEKSVRNFATAQKSLMDLVVKPSKAPRTEQKRKAPRIRPRAVKMGVEERAPEHPSV